MARNLSDVKVGDTLVSPTYLRREPERLDEYVAVKIGRKYVHVLLRYYYDQDVEQGRDPAADHMTINVAIDTGHHHSGYGSGTSFYTPAQWEAREVIANARKRFSDALKPLGSRDSMGVNWGATLSDVPDEAIVELLDDLTATIEAHRRRWGTDV